MGVLLDVKHGGLGVLGYYLESAIADASLAITNWDYKMYCKNSEKKKAKEAKKADEEKVSEVKVTEPAADETKAAETSTEEKAEVVPVEQENSVTEATAEDLFVTEVSKPIVPISFAQAQEIISKAINSFRDVDPTSIRLTCLGVMYCTGVINEEIVYKNLDQNNTDEIACMNTLCRIWNGLTFNPAYPIPKISEISSDPSKITNTLGLVRSVIGDDLCIDEMIVRTKEAVKAEESERLKKEGVEVDPIEPIFFVNKNLELNDVPKYIIHPGLTDEDSDKLKQDFGDLLDGYDYQFNNAGGITELVIKRDDNGTFDVYVIDTGSITGEGIHIINVTSNLLRFPISLKDHRDIAKKVLANRDAELDQDEQNKISKVGFGSFDYYRAFDFSTYGKLVKFKLKGNDKEKLKARLDAIMNNLPWNTEELPTEMPRMRFTKFKSVYSFNLVCDDKVEMQPASDFNNYIDHSVYVLVRADNVIVHIKDKDYTFKIK